MEAVGICGSDVHYLVKGYIGHFVVKSPMIVGKTKIYLFYVRENLGLMLIFV